MAPLHPRSFVNGLALGLVILAAILVYRWHPNDPKPFVSYAQQGEDRVIADVFEKLVRIDHPPAIARTPERPTRLELRSAEQRRAGRFQAGLGAGRAVHCPLITVSNRHRAPREPLPSASGPGRGPDTPHRGPRRRPDR